jgi:hypothetical protein
LDTSPSQGTRSVKAEAAASEAAVLDWLQCNKALHAIVLPSIVIDGSTHLQDQRKINLFVKGTYTLMAAD